MSEKTFPSSVQAERSLLGCLMLDPTLISKVRDAVSSEDFYAGVNRRIFELITRMHDGGDTIDILTVTELVLASKNPDRDYGGGAYVLGLADKVPTTLNFESYATIIRSNAVRRMLVMGFKKLEILAHNGESDIADIASACADLAKKASEQAPGRSMWKDMEHVLGAHFRELNLRIDAHNNDAVIGVPTGIRDLDEMLHGLRPGKLYILAGRPAMGKSALLGNILGNASRSGHRCAEFSLEMGDVELVDRMLADVARVDYGDIQRGRLNIEQMRRIDDAKDQMWSWPLHIDDTPTRTITQIAFAGRQLKAMHPDLSLIGVDYLQLASSSPGGESRREQQVSAISRGLKLLAREIDVAVVCLGQLNRECERRPNKRPMLSDLRESGAIEQDADCVMFVYRDEYYNPDSPDLGVAEVIVSKHRGFQTGKVRLDWKPKNQRFSSGAAVIRKSQPRASHGSFTQNPDDF